jgi:hypothetical protein
MDPSLDQAKYFFSAHQIIGFHASFFQKSKEIGTLPPMSRKKMKTAFSYIS